MRTAPAALRAAAVPWSLPLAHTFCYPPSASMVAPARRSPPSPHLRPPRMQLFAESLQGFNVSIVIYVRRALPMLLSRYYQLQEGGWGVGAGRTAGVCWP